MDNNKVSDVFDDVKDFGTLLEEAEMEASQSMEIEFVANMMDKWNKFQGEMFISPKQLAWLRRIAGEEAE